jgi:hypothetical protein
MLVGRERLLRPWTWRLPKGRAPGRPKPASIPPADEGRP